MLPSPRTRLVDGMPCTISVSIEVHSVLGNPYSPLNEGVAPSWLRMNVSAAASRSSVDRPGRRISCMRASVPATIRPARAIASISRGDLSVIMLLAKGPTHAAGDLIDRSDRGNAAHRLARVVPREQRRGLLPVGAEARGDGGRIVVGAMFQAPSAVQPGQDLLVGYIEEQHGVQLAPFLRQDALHPFGLRDGADHPVEDYATFSLRLGQLLAHDTQNDVVAHQVARLHDRLGLEAERGSVPDGVAQQVAGRELRKLQGLGQDGTLRPLAGAGRAHQKDIHAYPLKSCR